MQLPAGSIMTLIQLAGHIKTIKGASQPSSHPDGLIYNGQFYQFSPDFKNFLHEVKQSGIIEQMVEIVPMSKLFL